jgi:hypothetical protein
LQRKQVETVNRWDRGGQQESIKKPLAVLAPVPKNRSLVRSTQRLPPRTPSILERAFLLVFSRATPGMRFDVIAGGSRRINGVRNIRQALASPHLVLHSRFGAAHFSIAD